MVCPRLCGAVCRDQAQYPVFAPYTAKGGVRFWSFCILLLMICTNCRCLELFLVLYSFFEFCCYRGEVCLGATISRKGPRSQAVSDGSNVLKKDSFLKLIQTLGPQALLSMKNQPLISMQLRFSHVESN